MARFKDKERAKTLRAQGKSYSEIKQLLGISKSTLSGWLADMPLSAEQIRNLRDLNPRRIESFRDTMRRKREVRMRAVYSQVKKEIGKLSKRDLFVAGIYLYWGEGTKMARGKVAITNTDPAMIMAFLNWAETVGIPKEKMRVRLHLYKDMDIDEETAYWEKTLGIPKHQFRKPYIKDSKFAYLTYKSGFGHGTCNVNFENIHMWEYITMALKFVREQHMRP